MRVLDAALLEAAGQGQCEQVRRLLEAGADLQTINKSGWTALHCAAHGGNVCTLSLLLNRGADVQAHTREGATALTLAAWLGGPEAVRLLLDWGAGQDPQELQAALRATMYDNGQASIPLLVEVGAKIGFGDAIVLVDASAVSKFLHEGADANDCGEAYPPLLLALTSQAWSGYIERVMRLLLEYGADVNGTTPEGKTALMSAALLGYVEIVRLLLEYGADVHVHDPRNQTALYYAGKGGCQEVVEMLQSSEWQK